MISLLELRHALLSVAGTLIRLILVKHPCLTGGTEVNSMYLGQPTCWWVMSDCPSRLLGHAICTISVLSLASFTHQAVRGIAGESVFSCKGPLIPLFTSLTCNSVAGSHLPVKRNY